MDTRCVLSADATLERLTHLHTRSDAHMSAVLQCVRVAVDNADESANTVGKKWQLTRHSSSRTGRASSSRKRRMYAESRLIDGSCFSFDCDVFEFTLEMQMLPYF